MIYKQTAVNQIEIASNGVVQVRMSLAVIEGGTQLNNSWHRTSLPPGINVDEQMAIVNSHIAQMGYPPVSTAEIDNIKAHCALTWTPSVISAYAQAQA